MNFVITLGKRLATYNIPWLSEINGVKWKFSSVVLETKRNVFFCGIKRQSQKLRRGIYIYEPFRYVPFHNILFAITMQLLIYFMYFV